MTATAARWYRKAAESRGTPRRKTTWALVVRRGQEELPEDYQEAVKWYPQGGRARLTPRRRNNLGFMYRDGEGVLQDDTEAMKWYRRAAKQGYAAAQCNRRYHVRRGGGRAGG